VIKVALRASRAWRSQAPAQCFCHTGLRLSHFRNRAGHLSRKHSAGGL